MFDVVLVDGTEFRLPMHEHTHVGIDGVTVGMRWVCILVDWRHVQHLSEVR